MVRRVAGRFAGASGLANLAAFGLDRRLAGLAAALGATYTRYADDLTLSGGAGIGWEW